MIVAIPPPPSTESTVIVQSFPGDVPPKSVPATTIWFVALYPVPAGSIVAL